MKTGLPHNDAQSGFHAPQRIVELSADADELIALSDEGWFYRVVFNLKKSRTNTWYDIHGWPSPSPLKLNGLASHNRGWAVGKRNSSVRYYEDIFGNQHHYGTAGVMTNYLLLADGQEIRFGDVGLPSDFSRTIIGPERGSFIAESISASASTIFLIGAAGEMYTRLADFDTIGSNPMLFKYTYKPYVSKIPGTKYLSIFEPWGLPGEGWRAQPRIPLWGRAVISRHITIVQNGMGNAARELRVAGRDAAGEIGYWSKPIFGDVWSFIRTPIKIPEEDFLHPEGFTNGRGPRGPIADVHLRGSLWKDGQIVPKWSFEIPDFNILEGPCTLIIRRGTERVEIAFHQIEAWTYQRRVNPGRDGTPKAYLATMEIPTGALDGISAEFRAELEQTILSNDRELFRYFAEATTDYILIEPRDRSKAGYALLLTASGDSNTPPATFRVEKAAKLAEFERYASGELSMPSRGPFLQEDLIGLKSRIAANKALAAEMATRIKAFQTTQLKADVSRFGYSTLNLVTHATLLYRIEPVHILTRHSSAVLALNDDQLDLVAGTRAWLDGMLLDLIDRRVEAYSAVQHKLEGGAAIAFLPPGYSETYRSYMASVGLPATMEGYFVPGPSIGDFHDVAGDGTVSARLGAVTFTHDFPGWLMEVGKEPALTLLVELEGAARKIYNRDGVGPTKKPLKLRARLHLVSTGSEERDRDLYLRTIGNAVISDGGIPAFLYCDGSMLTIKKISSSSTEILFRGLLPQDNP